MSLYRQHQRIEKFRELANSARFSFPVFLTMKISGCSSITETAGDGWWIVIGSAAASAVGCWGYRKASRALNAFIKTVNTSPNLQKQYHHDAAVGKRDDLINGLQSEMNCYLMLAAHEAKQGRTLTAGFLYGRAKITEGRLRHHGY